MHPINVLKVSKEDRGWEFGCLTFWKHGSYIWFYHNESGKYNEKPIIGLIMHFIRCIELGNRDIIIVLCDNIIERYVRFNL